MFKTLILQFKDLSLFFYLALFAICGFVIGLSCWNNSVGIELLVAIFGILYALFAGERRLICFVFGILYSLLYAYISFKAKLYGDVMLNLFYLPINILGIWTWRNNQITEKVIVQSLRALGFVVCALSVALLSIVYGMFLKSIGSNFAYLNALSVVLQMVAFYLQAKRYVENYLFVTLANAIAIYIWIAIYQTDSQAMPQLLNAIVFFGIGVWYWRIWMKEMISGWAK